MRTLAAEGLQLRVRTWQEWHVARQHSGQSSISSYANLSSPAQPGPAHAPSADVCGMTFLDRKRWACGRAAQTALQPGHEGAQHLARACSPSMCRVAGAPGMCTVDDGVQVMGVSALWPPGALLLHKVVADGRVAVPRILQADFG